MKPLKLMEELNDLWVFKLLGHKITHAGFMSNILPPAFQSAYKKGYADAKANKRSTPDNGIKAGFLKLKENLK